MNTFLTPAQKISESLKKAYKEGRRIPFDGKNPNPKLPVPPKEELEKLYIEEKQSTWQLAQVYKVSQMQIRRWLIAHDIPRRSYGEASKITLNGFKENEAHPNWVGDKVSYPALHTWVRRRLGTPKKCEICGDTTKKRYDWANKDGKYKRNLTDWMRLCTKCHRKYDKENNLQEITPS